MTEKSAARKKLNAIRRIMLLRPHFSRKWGCTLQVHRLGDHFLKQESSRCTEHQPVFRTKVYSYIDQKVSGAFNKFARCLSS